MVDTHYLNVASYMLSLFEKSAEFYQLNSQSQTIQCYRLQDLQFKQQKAYT